MAELQGPPQMAREQKESLQTSWAAGLGSSGRGEGSPRGLQGQDTGFPVEPGLGEQLREDGSSLGVTTRRVSWLRL